MPSGIKLDKGWRKFTGATNAKKFSRLFHQRRKKALDKIAKRVIREAVNNSSGFARNANLTLVLKGGKPALQDSNKFIKSAVSTKAVGNKLFVGVLRDRKDVFSKAAAIHAGTSVKVSSKMRMMFFALAAVSRKEMSPSKLRGRARALYRKHKGPWYPLKTNTTVIRIKGRPFMQKAFEDPAVHTEAAKEMEKAVDRVFTQLVLEAK